MHESGLIGALLRQVEAQARAASARRVLGVELWVGALSGFSEAHLREHFAHEVQGTLADGARLTVVCSDEITHPDAAHLVLRSIEIG
jgi:hydrogenase nickel incorporation protein HypA/HybF